MRSQGKPVVIMLAEDDDDDFLLTKQAFEECRVLNRLQRVNDGEELMDYLRRKGKFQDPATSPEVGVILLDLNMPRKDGREALHEIKADPALRHYPIVVLTTSKSEEDVVRSYEIGISSYIRKPVGFEALVRALMVFSQYWFEIVELPTKG
jgi:CheY-like chemotaxis protein